MAKKSNNNAFYALAGAAGVGMLAFALWPREQRWTDSPQTNYANDTTRMAQSEFCAKYPYSALCDYDWTSPLRGRPIAQAPEPDPSDFDSTPQPYNPNAGQRNA